MTISAQRQFLATIEGIDGYWAAKSGGETSADSRKVWDGGSLKPETLTDPSETGNVTLSRPYRPERDGPLVKQLRRQVGIMRRTITDVDTDRQLSPVGDPTVYPNATLVRLAAPERNASSGDAGTIETEWSVDDVA